jgi:hypothetical protein
MCYLADSVSSLLSSGMMFWVIIGTIAVVAILSGAITRVLNVRARERTRREIAAYLAEGSIDKDTALAMLKTGQEEDEESEEA